MTFVRVRQTLSWLILLAGTLYLTWGILEVLSWVQVEIHPGG